LELDDLKDPFQPKPYCDSMLIPLDFIVISTAEFVRLLQHNFFFLFATSHTIIWSFLTFRSSSLTVIQLFSHTTQALSNKCNSCLKGKVDVFFLHP